MSNPRLPTLLLTDSDGDVLRVEEDNIKPAGSRLWFDDMNSTGNGIFLSVEDVKKLRRHLTKWLVTHGHRNPS